MRLFLLVDDFHRAQLWRAADRPCGEGCAQDIHRRICGCDLADDAAHHMRDMGEALDLHELRHAHTAGDADASEVVACEIDEHRVLGAFFCIGTQLCGEQCVLLIRLAALACAGDGVGVDRVAGDFNQHLGGGTDELDLAEVVVEHIGRGIDLP